MNTMENRVLIDYISNFLSDVTSQSVNFIAEKFETLNIKKGDHLIKEGKTSGFYFLTKGIFRCFTYDFDGNEVTTNFIEGPRVIFEPASFCLQKPSTEVIQAITNCSGYFASYEKFNVLFNGSIEFREFVRSVIINEFAQFKGETFDKLNKSAEQRYLELLENNKELFQVAKLKHISSYLGLTATSLSRIRKQLAIKK